MSDSRLPRSACVFCGARPGTDPAFAEAARDLGRGLAERRIRLVYGAGDVGLMGTVAAAAEAAGGTRIGVIPTHLLGREASPRPEAGRIVTETMHERKKVMLMNAEALIVLPGGLGTLDEFFEALTWRQLGLHAKPIYLLNVGGFWAPLLALLDAVVAAGFADRRILDTLTVVEDVETLFRTLEG